MHLTQDHCQSSRDLSQSRSRLDRVSQWRQPEGKISQNALMCILYWRLLQDDCHQVRLLQRQGKITDTKVNDCNVTSWQQCQGKMIDYQWLSVLPRTVNRSMPKKSFCVKSHHLIKMTAIPRQDDCDQVKITAMPMIDYYHQVKMTEMPRIYDCHEVKMTAIPRHGNYNAKAGWMPPK